MRIFNLLVLPVLVTVLVTMGMPVIMPALDLQRRKLIANLEEGIRASVASCSLFT
jgi:hypothetical protein